MARSELRVFDGIDRRLFIAGAMAGLVGCGSEQSGPSKLQMEDLPPSAVPRSPAGNRILGLVPTEREAGDFNPVIDLLEEAGARNSSLSLYWDQIETSPGVFDPDPNFVSIANQFYNLRRFPLTVSLSGIDTNTDRRPPDLAGLAYDDPAVVERYVTVARWVIDNLADVAISCFSMGNEIDATLAADTEAWAAYRSFFAKVAPALRTMRKGLVIGSKATFGVINEEPARSEYRALLQDADAAMLTYYPLRPDFSVKPLDQIATDFEAMVAFAREKPVRILECGFPSSQLLGSSEAMQADFISAVFAAWDAKAAQISHIDFFSLHDFSPAIVQELGAYYGIGSDRFAAFLGTLGLREWADEGSDKLGWRRFMQEAKARGFS
ncbi:hypothetical protein MWU38_03225 [Qipengyuania sp. S6317L1]|uniref:hypothetical protein n=1 Tax=Qipengyuania sp. S6317L1 TaxID=2926410 RepID=UPI001FF279B0|nr:hypothetical protein [Qipengyuania sp. S6317L1]MCK0098387.1 hypothetical protein [Qipengyuania sp. S6317L1]